MRRSVFFFVIFSFQTILSQTITLRDTTNQYDYIIITIPEFVTSCEAFKQHKETVRDFRTLIVDTTQIFAEFDSSSSPQDNIRDFISYAGTFWLEPKSKFILIVGNVTAVPNFGILFPPQPVVYYQSDYYFTQNIYENDSTTTDFYVGRIPCKDTTELTNYLSKVIDYENTNSLDNWMNNSLFICEDDITFGFFDAAVTIADDYLPDFIRSFYIINDTNSVYYGNKDSIYKAINEIGNSVVWFEGHNRDTFCVNPAYFNISDLGGLDNLGMPFITVYVGGQSAITDTNTNMTREMLVKDNAGSMGGFVFVGVSYWGVTQAFQHNWAQRLFNPNMQSLGEIFNLDSFSSAGIFGYMKKITNLWADPSIKLKYDVTVAVNNSELELPIKFAVEQNYPNPFNPTTNIKFQIAEHGFVSLKIYDILGNEIATLVNKENFAGNYEIEWNATGLPSGIYFYQLRTGNFVETKKMVLMK